MTAWSSSVDAALSSFDSQWLIFAFPFSDSWGLPDRHEMSGPRNHTRMSFRRLFLQVLLQLMVFGFAQMDIPHGQGNADHGRKRKVFARPENFTIVPDIPADGRIIGEHPERLHRH
jgi:hypothetical protein